MTHRPVLAVVLAAAVLTGCSGAQDVGERIDMTPYRDRVDGDRGDDRDDDGLAECGDPDDAQEWELSGAGAELEVTVPADADDDPVEDLEDYREDAGAGPVCWVVVDVDNTGGTSVVDLPRVEVVTAGGEGVRLQRASEALASWSDLRPDDDDATARAVELIAGADGVVGPGEEGEVVLVAGTDLDDPRGVRLQLAEGGDLLEASR